MSTGTSTTATAKYAKPTQISGRRRLPCMSIWPLCSTGPYTPQETTVRAIDNPTSSMVTVASTMPRPPPEGGPPILGRKINTQIAPMTTRIRPAKNNGLACLYDFDMYIVTNVLTTGAPPNTNGMT